MRTHLVWLLAAGCGGELATEAEATLDPILGIQSGQDAPDTACHVVLRAAERPRQNGGYETQCVNGTCWYVFQGVVDISAEALAQGGGPGVLYQGYRGAERPWFEVGMTPSAGAPEGYQRYVFRFYENTVTAGTSVTSLSRTRIEFIPFLRGPDGSRAFDHNRNPDPFTNYVFESANNWSIGESGVCASPAAQAGAVLRFPATFVNSQEGALVQGQALTVQFDPARFTTCTAGYAGGPAYGTVGYARFWPSGQTVTGPVQALASGNLRAIPWVVNIPVGATQIEVWFLRSDRTGCRAYDSNFGQNYRYEIWQNAPAAPGWAGDWGASTNRACERRDLPEPLLLDRYVFERACFFVEADVWVPGVTDSGSHPEVIWAQVQYQVDGGAPETEALQFAGRFGNNYRFRWYPPRHALVNQPWQRYEYRFRFSTNGQDWLTIGDGEAPRSFLPAP